MVRLRPGLSLPLGTVGTEGVATPRSSGSVDPVVSVEAGGGGQVVALGFAQVRTPVLPGRDGVTDGVFARVDGLAGVRVGRAVPVLGPSVVVQAADAQGARGYSELSAVAGVTVHADNLWG